MLREPVFIRSLGSKNVSPLDKKKRMEEYAIFKCDCGNEFTTMVKLVKAKRTRSCGCLVRKHNNCYHPIYYVWNKMLHRCENKNDKSYKNYGGRGIIVCERWHNLNNFIEDMYPTYQEGLTIDRINNNGNYELTNCRWANATTQARNTQRLRKDNTSGYRGITFDPRNQKYKARISVDNKRIYLGEFSDIMDAVLSYDNYIINNNLEHTRNLS